MAAFDLTRALPQASTPPAAPGRGQPRLLLSSEILAGESEVCIDHEGTLYRLKVTSLGRLVLNK